MRKLYCTPNAYSFITKRFEAAENEADKAKYREWLDTHEAIVHERIPCTQEAWDAMSEEERSEYMIALPEGIACTQADWDIMDRSVRTFTRMAKDAETKAQPGSVAAESNMYERVERCQAWLENHVVIA
jgi:hypothetical protein